MIINLWKRLWKKMEGWIKVWRIGKSTSITFGKSHAIYLLHGGKDGYGIALMLSGYYLELAFRYENYNKDHGFVGQTR